MLANETKADGMLPTQKREDRELFVRNLGELLSQTREGITRAWLDDTDVVHIIYRNGHEDLANVKWDSYMAIIKDVVRSIEL